MRNRIRRKGRDRTELTEEDPRWWLYGRHKRLVPKEEIEGETARRNQEAAEAARKPDAFVYTVNISPRKEAAG